MHIAVVGLGLIGGSFCKTIKKYTSHIVYGYDIAEDILEKALLEKAIDNTILPADLSSMDLVIICLHPIQILSFLEEHVNALPKNGIVMDTSGVKAQIVQKAEPLLLSKDIYFVGTHPMAGREFSGFDYALDTLFDSANFIITPTKNTNANAVKTVERLAYDLHFGKVVYTSPQEHDKIIAYTSQLAHVVSNAYVKSPTVQQEAGFSAGSFLDLTRVAKLHEYMWADLFLMNKDHLLYEIDEILKHLSEYREALALEDKEQLIALLRDGREAKEKHDNQNSEKK